MLRFQRRVAQILVRDPRRLPGLLRLKGTRVPRAVLRAPERVRFGPPVVLAIRVSYDCNLRCRMCNQWGERGVFTRPGATSAARTLTVDEWKAVIDEAAAYRPYVYFTGGEPLLVPELFDLIRHASDHHLVTSLNTNGLLLASRAEELVESGLDYLYASLDAMDADGPADGVIRRTAGGASSSARVIEGIRRVIELRGYRGAGLPVVQIQTVLVRENVGALYALGCGLARDVHPDVWGLQMCVYTSPENSRAGNDLLMRRFGHGQVFWDGFVRDFEGMDFAALEADLARVRAERWPFRLRLYRPLDDPSFDVRRWFTHPERHPVSDPPPCANPYVFVQVQPDGGMSFCGGQPDHIFGNVREGGVLAAWHGASASAWRRFRASVDPPTCRRCFSRYEYDSYWR